MAKTKVTERSISIKSIARVALAIAFILLGFYPGHQVGRGSVEKEQLHNLRVVTAYEKQVQAATQAQLPKE